MIKEEGSQEEDRQGVHVKRFKECIIVPCVSSYISYISSDLFYFVNLTSSCSLIPRDDVFSTSCANLTERPAFVIYCNPLLCSDLL